MTAVPPVTRPPVELPAAHGFAWPRLLAAWVPGDPLEPTPQIRRLYAVKASIAAWLRPSSVLEIGVRAGYSALALYMGHPFRLYHGYDSDRGDWGGVPGYLDHASGTIAAAGVVAFSVQVVDTQQLSHLPAADLAHVDGDHSWAGAKHDIELCLDAGARYVLVDDVEFIPAVRAAAEDVIEERGLGCVFVPDYYRGNFVIANAGVQFPPIPTI